MTHLLTTEELLNRIDAAERRLVEAVAKSRAEQQLKEAAPDMLVALKALYVATEEAGGCKYERYLAYVAIKKAEGGAE